MLYAILSTDVPDSAPLRAGARAQHLARLGELLKEGRLVVAGPHPAIDAEDPGAAGMSGSLVIAQFDSLETAQRWAGADPFVTAGVYASVVVKPFKQTMP